MGEWSRLSSMERHALERRRQRLARIERQRTNAASIPPATILAAHLAPRSVESMDVNFNRAGFGYDESTTSAFTVNADPKWTRPGGSANNQNLKVHIGTLDSDAFVWVWCSLAWLNNSASATAFQGRLCAALYAEGGDSHVPYARSENTSADWKPADAHYRESTLQTALLVPRSFDVMQSDGVTPADWWIGMQMQAGSPVVTNIGTQQVNRQSIICFVTAAPFTQPDLTGQEGGSSTGDVIGGGITPRPNTTDIDDTP